MIIFIVFGCKKDDNNPSTPPPEINDGELITNVTLVFTDQEGVVSEFYFSDPDGPGGEMPQTSSIQLSNNKIYQVEILLSDQSDPSDIILLNDEIIAEAEDHQFFYQLINNEDIVEIEYNDDDPNGMPLGLSTKWTTINPTSGSELIRLILRHEPDKFASGVAQGDPSNAGGETDIEIDFGLIVE